MVIPIAAIAARVTAENPKTRDSSDIDSE